MPNSHNPLNRSNAAAITAKWRSRVGLGLLGAPQPRNENEQQDECVERKRDPSQRLRRDKGERERCEHALAVQITMVEDGVRVGMFCAVEGCD